MGEIIKGKKKGWFIKDPHQFSTMPPRVLEMKQELLEKIQKIREISENSEINKESEDIKTHGNMVYQSKTEGIKKYAVFGFALLCVGLSVLLIFKKL